MKMDEKAKMIETLSKYPDMVIKTALAYAINMYDYGVDVTTKWETATQQVDALYRARQKGYYDALEKIHKNSD